MAGKLQKWLPLFSNFIDNLRIVSKEAPSTDERGSKLVLWDSQSRVLNYVGTSLTNGVHVFYILKSRQLGVTTVTLAILLFWLAVHPRIFGALVVDNDPNRDVFRDILTRYMDSFPTQYFGKAFTITASNSKYMQFSNGSRLDFLVAGKSKTTWGESRAYTVALLTEVSKYGRAEGLQSFMETLSEHNPDRLYLFESTAHGMNHWMRMWEDAGEDIFTRGRIFVGWWAKPQNAISRRDPRFKVFGAAHPTPREQERIEAVKDLYNHKISAEQLAWYRWRESSKATTAESLDESQPWTENDAFIQTGYSFFQTRNVADLIEVAREVPFMGFKFYLGNDFKASKMEWIDDARRVAEVELRVWTEPADGAQYVIGADPAFGRNDNNDRHCISVFRCFADKMVQVAEYADNKCDTRQVAWVLAYMAGYYKNCMVNLEIGGPGHAVMNELKSLREQLRSEEYQKAIGHDGASDYLETMRWYLYHRPDSMGPGYAYNWETTHRSKWTMLSGLRDSLITSQLAVHSVPCLKEMMAVVQDGGEIGAPSGLHDDRVFAAALADVAWKQWFRPNLISQGLTYNRVMVTPDHLEAKISEILNAKIFTMLNAPVDEPEPNQYLSDRGLA